MICSTQAFDSCEKFENRRESDFCSAIQIVAIDSAVNTLLAILMEVVQLAVQLSTFDERDEGSEVSASEQASTFSNLLQGGDAMKTYLYLKYTVIIILRGIKCIFV